MAERPPLTDTAITEPVISAYREIAEAIIRTGAATVSNQLPIESAKTLVAETWSKIKEHLTLEKVKMLSDFTSVAIFCLGEPTRDNHALLEPFGLTKQEITELLTWQATLARDLAWDEAEARRITSNKRN